MTTYYYFVSYTYKNQDGLGHGFSSATRSQPIQTAQDLEDTRRAIENQLGDGHTVVINHYQLMRIENPRLEVDWTVLALATWAGLGLFAILVFIGHLLGA